MTRSHFNIEVGAPKEWYVGIYAEGTVYTELAEAAAKRIVEGPPGRVLIIAQRPDGTLIMQERDWGPDDNEEGVST